MTVECAFGCLKGRWWCLAKHLDVDISLVPKVISTRCVLHNICEMHNTLEEEINATHDPSTHLLEAAELETAEISPLRVREAIPLYFSGQR